MAHLKTLETRENAENRQVWKFRVVRLFYERGYSREQIMQLFRFVDWIMRLPIELETAFKNELERFEEERKMTYVTSIERIGIEKGRQEGIAQTALRLLVHKFGALDSKIELRIQKLSIEKLNLLIDTLFSWSSLDDLVAWLDLQV